MGKALNHEFVSNLRGLWEGSFLVILAVELDRVTPLERCDERNA
jgi:hypothetical protein